MQTSVENIHIKELNLDIIQPNKDTFMTPDQGGMKIVVVGKPGCFKIGTKVLMYDGTIKNVEQVVVGDQVMGWDSTPRTVLELCRNNDVMYKINPSIWNGYTVNSEHILVMRNKQEEVIELTVKKYLSLSELKKSTLLIFKRPVEFKHQQTEIDPYTFGKGYKHTRRIPKEYLINSRENRLQLLAGIIDHDRKISTDNTELRDDIIFLANSLGVLTERDGNNVTIYGRLSCIPCRNHSLPNTDRDYTVSNFRVEKLGVDNYYGFTLDGDHKFLLGSFDVVHNTGKTTLIASLLYSKKHIYPTAMAMSGTEDSNHFYRSIFPSTFVFNNYDEEQITKFIKRQKLAKEHLANPWSVLILDDCTDDPSLFKKPLQQGMYKRGRHWKMLYILSLQYGMDVRPVIRTNVDGVFILREPNIRNRKVMYENYGGIVPDFKLFCDILDQITDDYTALYIHNATRSNDWKECVFWYKAKPIPSDFKFGSDEYWAFHFARYNPEYIDPVGP
jgi:hypothetical protein